MSATSESLDLLNTLAPRLGAPFHTTQPQSLTSPGQTWGLNPQFQVQLKPLVSAPLREIKQNKPGLFPFHSLSPQTFAALQDVPELELVGRIVAAAALRKPASPSTTLPCHGIQTVLPEHNLEANGKGRGEGSICHRAVGNQELFTFTLLPGIAPCLCHTTAFTSHIDPITSVTSMTKMEAF